MVTDLLSGGDKRDRTADLLVANEALSQLSYTPRFLKLFNFITAPWTRPAETEVGHKTEHLALPAELRPQVVESVQFPDFTLCKLSGGWGPLCG